MVLLGIRGAIATEWCGVVATSGGLGWRAWRGGRSAPQSTADSGHPSRPATTDRSPDTTLPCGGPYRSKICWSALRSPARVSASIRSTRALCYDPRCSRPPRLPSDGGRGWAVRVGAVRDSGERACGAVGGDACGAERGAERGDDASGTRVDADRSARPSLRCASRPRMSRPRLLLPRASSPRDSLPRTSLPRTSLPRASFNGSRVVTVGATGSRRRSAAIGWPSITPLPRPSLRPPSRCGSPLR